MVDQINDTEEIVVKPLRKQLKTVKTFAGSSIIGDGKVALILDVLGLAQRSGVVTEARDRALAEKTAETSASAGEKQTFLLFAGPGDSRMAIPLSTLARLEEFPVAQVEMSGSQWVTQYRGQILPLVRLNVVLEERRNRLRTLQAPPALDSGPIQVLVLNHDERSFGLVVERILDIVEDRAEVRSAATRASVLYSVVIGDRVTELLDIPAILRSVDSNPARPTAYLFLDGVSLRVRRPTGRKQVQMLVAYGIRRDGSRHLLAFLRSQGESQADWEGLLQDLYQRGLEGRSLGLILTDGCAGLAAAIRTVYPRVRHQRCWVHKMRNILEKARKRDYDEVKAGAQAIYLAESRSQAEAAFRRFRTRWQRAYGPMVSRLERDLPELLSFFAFPRHLWRKLRTTNVIERCFVEVRRRTRPMVCFVNVESVDRIIYSIFQRFNLEWKTRTLNLFTQAA